MAPLKEEGSVTPEDRGPGPEALQGPEAGPLSQAKPVRRKPHAESQKLEAPPPRPAQRSV
ncbi:hypothetical protein EYF80_066104 [Liparis tanakae]|uniref:Uncharacterized protein n=1 Tax=Liparis tanakae TaxID=230148 RepID=A0A4Z2E584_9TELE|nr:hypothetical protein EYF80_066104 [Liparis tanakae]